MIEFHPQGVVIRPTALYAELQNVVDMPSLCNALNLFLNGSVSLKPCCESLTVKKNREKNEIINSLKNKRQIYRQNHVYYPSPGYEITPVNIILSKRRQAIIEKELISEVLSKKPSERLHIHTSSYDPKIHEDYVYSDANWSSKDASL